MLRSTFFGIEIGKSGLVVSQLGLDVTGHNIANVDSEGYTRQRIISTAYDPFTTIGRALPIQEALIGGGVKIQIHDQIRSAYLDRRYRTENTIHAYWYKRTEGLTYLESFFDNVVEETSLNYSVAKFFEAIKVLSTDSVEKAPRTLLQTAGMDLAQHLNSIYAGLIDLQETQNLAVKTTVEKINSIATDIVELNKSIYAFEVTDHIALDLRDKRNVLLDELSSIIDIDYWEEPDGTGMKRLVVEISSQKLVSHDKSWELGCREIDNVLDGEDPVWQICWIDPKTGEPYDDGGGNPDPAYDFKVLDGELRAYLDMRDSLDVKTPGIPYYIEMLNDLARALVQEINGIHVKGWSDNPAGSENGVLFFDADGAIHNLVYDADGNVTDYSITNIEDITAKNIRLSDAVMNSAYNIACSTEKIVKNGNPEELQRGNNENTNLLYELFLKKDIVVNGNDVGSFDGFVTAIRFDVGKTLDFARKTADNSNILMLAAENQRISVSGVSLDEEMTNLIKYQHAYSGASRVITAMDEALDKLINGTGRVGL